MPNEAHAVKLMRRSELETCARVTRLRSSQHPDAREKHYEGMLLCEVRVGVPLVLVLNGRRRLVTSTIKRVEAVEANVIEVETSNNRYSIHRLVTPEVRGHHEPK